MRLLLLALLGVTLLSAGCAAKREPRTIPSQAAIPQVEAAHNDVTAAARSSIGVPYRFGGKSPETGFDCSGLVCWSYEQVGISIPRRARDQHRFGVAVGKESLQPGDIVVFKGTNSRTGWHSGIYTGNGMFVHSPTKGKTVTETSLADAYFAKRFAGARRIPRDGSAAAMLAEFRENERAAKAAQALAQPVGRNKAASKEKPLVASLAKKKSGKSLNASQGSSKKQGRVNKKLAVTKPKPAARQSTVAKAKKR